MQWRRSCRGFALVAGLLTFLLDGQEHSPSQSFQNAPPGSRLDLNGEWQGQFTVNQPSLKIEKVMIQQIGDQITATKITGDEFVPAGKVTVRGAYNANPFSAEQVCADAGYTNTRWIKASITILDRNHLKLEGGCGETRWERVGKPTLALDGAILFDLDRYQLKADAASVLERVNEQLRALHPKSHILIAGYTDSTGTVSHNLRLSVQRAQSVASWLQEHGMSKSRLQVKGFGQENPRYPNTNEEARARNRRVEIVILD